MSYIKNEIVRAAKVTSVKIIEVSHDEYLSITKQVYDKYIQKPTGSFLWESFKEKHVISNNKDAWRLLKNIIGPEESILFFNPEDE